ncbi:MAG: hypothetical protein BWY76_02566 [bacterium ADurb.Bin429]|nr:MAG: hypothetical protein BWY76_02566 [bacterium ADurb.Bin429]
MFGGERCAAHRAIGGLGCRQDGALRVQAFQFGLGGGECNGGFPILALQCGAIRPRRLDLGFHRDQGFQAAPNFILPGGQLRLALARAFQVALGILPSPRGLFGLLARELILRLLGGKLRRQRFALGVASIQLGLRCLQFGFAAAPGFELRLCLGQPGLHFGQTLAFPHQRLFRGLVLLDRAARILQGGFQAGLGFDLGSQGCHLCFGLRDSRQRLFQTGHFLPRQLLRVAARLLRLLHLITRDALGFQGGEAFFGSQIRPMCGARLFHHRLGCLRAFQRGLRIGAPGGEGLQGRFRLGRLLLRSVQLSFERFHIRFAGRDVVQCGLRSGLLL